MVSVPLVVLMVPLLSTSFFTDTVWPENKRMPLAFIVRADTVGDAARVAPAVLLTVRLNGPLVNPVARLQLVWATDPPKIMVAEAAVPALMVPELLTGVAVLARVSVLLFKVSVEETPMVNEPMVRSFAKETLVLAAEVVNIPVLQSCPLANSLPVVIAPPPL